MKIDNIDSCIARKHMIFRNDLIAFCFVCHFRTDLAFALYSQQLLSRVKMLAVLEERQP